MKKIFASLFVIALIGAGCNKSEPVKPTPPTPITDNNSWQTYRYQPYGFEFKYPASWVFVQPSFKTLTDSIVSVQTPENLYPKTNFSNAVVTVNASVGISENQCLSNSQTKAPLLEPLTINGQTFYVESTTDAGAGNFYDSKIYKTVHDKVCLEVIETIHTTNVGNYEPGTVTEVDQTEIKKLLQDILLTFKFTAK